MSNQPYHVGVVGESNYQPAIARCAAGEPVTIAHEQGNPWDALALAVIDRRGAKIGYIAKASWLRGAIHEEDRGCGATIASIERVDGGNLSVVLNAALNDGVIGTIAYRA